jgi:hypothetical protein
MDRREMVWSVIDWIDLALDWGQWCAVVNTVLNLWGPYNIRKFMTS